MNTATKLRDLLDRYAAGERDFRDLDLDDGVYVFDGMDLREAIFIGSFIVGSFRNANLECTNFNDCNVKTSDFTGANLAHATFRGAALDAAVFVGANLTGADFQGASEQGYTYGQEEYPLRCL